MLANLNAVPTEQVVPVFMAALPEGRLYRDDSCYVVAALLEAQHPHIMPVLPQALLACAHCLTADEEKEVSDDVKGRVAAALKTLQLTPRSQVPSRPPSSK